MSPACAAIPAMAAVAAESGAALVDHASSARDRNRDRSRARHRRRHVRLFRELRSRWRKRLASEREKIVLDPGVGFGKSLRQNLQAMDAPMCCGAISALPVLIGVSRKRFLGALTGAPTEERLGGDPRGQSCRLCARRRRFFASMTSRNMSRAFKVWTEIAEPEFSPSLRRRTRLGLARRSGAGRQSRRSRRQSAPRRRVVARGGAGNRGCFLALPHKALGRDRPAGFRQRLRSCAHARSRRSALLDLVQATERAMGRRRPAAGGRGPSTSTCCFMRICAGATAPDPAA